MRTAVAIIKRRPWWKFWPVICWRHLKIVERNNICGRCAIESHRRRLWENYDRRITNAVERRKNNGPS